jgi:RNA polymerase sigma-70 factor, ECF subfamily
MGVLTQTAVIGRGGGRGGRGRQGDDSEGELSSLVEGVRTGRAAALEGLITRVETRVRLWAARFTDDGDSADDVAQEVLIGLERRVRRFDGRSKFSTWLFTVTRNAALTRRRREARRAELLAARVADDGAVDGSNPDAIVLARLALRYFDTLPARQRLIFDLCDLRGGTPAEVARQLGMEQATVRAHLFKARRAIRAKLLEHHERLLQEYRS